MSRRNIFAKHPEKDPLSGQYMIRRFDRRDRDSVKDLFRQLTDSDFDIDELIEELHKDRNHLCLVAMDQENGRIIGFGALVWHISIPGGKTGQIEAMVTDKHNLRRGIGAKIYTVLERKAKEIKCKRIVLTSKPARKAAHALYQKMGFTQKETCVFIKDLKDNTDS